MTLPRFTAGAVGNLSFDHLNEAFGFIDSIRDDGAPTVEGLYKGGAIICAKITGQSTNDFSWEEVERISDTNAAFQIKIGGRNSTDGAGNTFGFPARAFNSPVPAVDQLVFLTGKHSADGKRYYVPLSASSSICAVVVSASPLVANIRWSYQVKAAWPTSAGVFTGTGASFTAFNGAENNTDNTVYGVGMIPPTGVTMTRQPIRVNTAVLCMKDSAPNSFYAFSVPNGYKAVC